MISCKIFSVVLLFLSLWGSQNNSEGEVLKAAETNTLRSLVAKQESIESFRGTLEVTRMDLPSTRDTVFYQIKNDRMCVDQIQGSPDDALKTGRLIPVTLYFDGTTYWDQQGDLIVRSQPGRNPLAEDLFVRLHLLKPSDLTIAQTNAPDGVCVFERRISNPSLENNRETTLENPALIAMMAKNGVSVDQIHKSIEKARQELPQGRERLWVRTDNGFCFLQEQFDEHGQVVRKKEYTGLKFNIPFAPELFQPNTSGKRVIESGWPYGEDVMSMITKERENIRLPSGVKVAVTGQSNVARQTDFIMKTYGELWLKHDLSSLSGLRGLSSAPSTKKGIVPSLLAEAVYVSVVENDRTGSRVALEKVEHIIGEPPLASYVAFQKALETAEKAIPPQESKDKRIQKLFETYKDGFPLANDIRNVAQDLQAVEDREPPRSILITTEPVYFACHSNELFYVDKAELDRKTFDAMRSLPSELDPEQRAKAFEEKRVGNEVFVVDPRTLLSGKLQLQPRSGAHGDSVGNLDRPDSKFQQILQRLNRESNPIVFLVREDSVEAFEKARVLAEAVGFNTTSVRRGKDQPITLELGAARAINLQHNN